MSTLERLITSGDIVTVILGVVLLEVLLLLCWWRVRGRGIRPLALLVNVGAGGSLMLALRASLTQQGTSAVAFWLLASLAFHIADLWVRWQSDT